MFARVRTISLFGSNMSLYSMLLHRHMMSLPISSALSHYFVSFCCSNASGKAHKPESIDIVERTVGREKSGQLFPDD